MQQSHASTNFNHGCMNLEDHANCYYLEKEITLLTVEKRGGVTTKDLAQKGMNKVSSDISAKWKSFKSINCVIKEK